MKVTNNKKMLAREIGRMPYFQVYFTQKEIINMLKENKISEEIINKARTAINSKIEKFRYAF